MTTQSTSTPATSHKKRTLTSRLGIAPEYVEYVVICLFFSAITGAAAVLLPDGTTTERNGVTLMLRLWVLFSGLGLYYFGKMTLQHLRSRQR